MKAIGNHFKRAKFEYLSITILVVLITLMLGNLYHWSDMDITVPLQYYGGDDMDQIVNAKTFTQQAWNLEVDRLGTPFSAQYYDFTASVMHNTDLVTMKFFAMFTNEPGTIVNLTFFSIFYLCGIISYLVMRELKLRNWIAIGGSFIYSMCSYIFMRNLGHLTLSSCYFIPLSVLLCMWIYTRDDYLVFNRNFFKNKRTWLTILFAFLIANNGIVYYPFFTCFIIVVAGVSKAIKKKDAKVLLKPFFIIACICFFIVMALVPIIIHILKNGTNSDAIERAGFSDAELYGLRIMQMFIPVNGHGISILETLREDYINGALHVNENETSYLGIAGIIGFLFLIVSLFLDKASEFWDKIRALAELNLGLTLLGISGGFGTVVAIVLTSNIRGYNRLSVFIFFICILAVCMVVNQFYKKHSWKVIIPAFLAFCIFTGWEQFPVNGSDCVYICKEDYYSDRDFVQSIEASVPQGSMIYQLPFHQYPEGGVVNNMMDYYEYIGYIHSNTLKWSYGSMKGTDYEKWNEDVGTSPVPEMISTLKETGFAGIYIDRRAYTEEELENLEVNLELETGNKKTVSNNGNLSFIKF